MATLSQQVAAQRLVGHAPEFDDFETPFHRYEPGEN
jgi:hypothetical protein